MPRISVIVPFYNVEGYIEKCLETLVNQTFQDIEIILVNDGSKDRSEEIAKKFANRYENKIVYLEKENGGLSSARNFGLAHARGEYVAFVDSDDYIEKNMYEKMYNLIIKERSDMVECDFYWEYPNKKKIDTGKLYNNKNQMLENVRVVAWNKLIKKEIIDKHGIEFPNGYQYEDVEFTYKLIPYIQKVSFLKEPMVHYIQRTKSISNSQNEKTMQIFDVLEHVINYYKENGLYKNYEKELEYIYVRYAFCSSLKRIMKIEDEELKDKLIKKTWDIVNEKFPNWKGNEVLKKNKTLKNVYLRTLNKNTYNLYTLILSIIG